MKTADERLIQSFLDIFIAFLVLLIALELAGSACVEAPKRPASGAALPGRLFARQAYQPSPGLLQNL
jgi:hypothetical protein